MRGRSSTCSPARRRSCTRGDDPVVGVVGASYGGALALMLGATDPRIDSVVAGITWNDLAQALDPVSAGWVDGSTPERLFKAGWAVPPLRHGCPGQRGPLQPVHRAALRALPHARRRRLADGCRPRPARAARRRSTVLSTMTAPTLLLQGLQDSLFGLDQAEANRRADPARGRACAGGLVRRRPRRWRGRRHRARHRRLARPHAAAPGAPRSTVPVRRPGGRHLVRRAPLLEPLPGAPRPRPAGAAAARRRRPVRREPARRPAGVRDVAARHQRRQRRRARGERAARPRQPAGAGGAFVARRSRPASCSRAPPASASASSPCHRPAAMSSCSPR